MANLYRLANRISGEVPGCDLDLVMWKITEALGKIYDEIDWSFQRQITYANWLCPGQVASSGTTTVVPYSNQVIFDAAATASLNTYLAGPGAVFVTTLQYRDPAYSIYNIVGYDNGTINPGLVTLTLDRPWLEPTSGPGQPYMIYQAYFVAPCKDFHKFIEIRDTTNSGSINFWGKTQADLAREDPQRTDFSDPGYCVPAGFDFRPGSSTLGYPMFELCPQQLSYLPYSFSYRRKGIDGYPGGLPESFQDFQNYPLPTPITEQLIGFETKVCLYEYKEANKDAQQARGSGANWPLLIQIAAKRYAELLNKLIAIDLNLNGEAMQSLPGRGQGNCGGPYSNQLGQFSVGGYPDYSD